MCAFAYEAGGFQVSKTNFNKTQLEKPTMGHTTNRSSALKWTMIVLFLELVSVPTWGETVVTTLVMTKVQCAAYSSTISARTEATPNELFALRACNTRHLLGF